MNSLIRRVVFKCCPGNGLPDSCCVNHPFERVCKVSALGCEPVISSGYVTITIPAGICSKQIIGNQGKNIDRFSCGSILAGLSVSGIHDPAIQGCVRKNARIVPLYIG